MSDVVVQQIAEVLRQQLVDHGAYLYPNKDGVVYLGQSRRDLDLVAVAGLVAARLNLHEERREVEQLRTDLATAQRLLRNPQVVALLADADPESATSVVMPGGNQ